MIRYIVYMLLVLNSVSFFGQSKNDKAKIMDLFSKSQSVYEGKSAFKFSIGYKFYPTYKATIPSEKYEGIILKRKRDFYSKIHFTESVKLQDHYLKIDNESKLLQITKVGKEEKTNEVYNLDNLISNFKTFELTDEGNYWVCTMTAPAITFVPYSKAKVYINKTDYTIHKQVLYYLTKNKYKDSKGKILSDYPRLEMILSNFETANIDFGSRFQLDSYIIRSNSKVTLSKKYKGYKIVD